MNYSDLVDMAETLGVRFSDPWAGTKVAAVLDYDGRAASLMCQDRCTWVATCGDVRHVGTRFQCLMEAVLYVLYGDAARKDAHAYCDGERVEIGCATLKTTLDVSNRSSNLELAFLLRATAARLENL